MNNSMLEKTNKIIVNNNFKVLGTTVKVDNCKASNKACDSKLVGVIHIKNKGKKF